MMIQQTGCCAVKEITSLEDYNQPMTAMAAFCDRLWRYEGEYDFWIGKYRNSSYHWATKPSGHYTFTAVIGYRNKLAKKPTYGPAFAAFIRRHKLGSVTGGKPEFNRVRHPTHLVRLWVWQPNPERLKTWYKQYRKTHKDEVDDV